MKIIKPSVEILTEIDGNDILAHLEKCGRVCYKSEDRISSDSAHKFLKNIIDRGHEAVIEHYAITVKFICDRGVMAEMTRHRLASFSIESSRYCNYAKDKFGNEITVIEPCFLQKGTIQYEAWESACKTAESMYFVMIENGCKPEEARSVLPNSLKTEIVMTANIREWRHFLKLRTSQAAHPQMREVVKELLRKFKNDIPILFDDIPGDA